MLARLPPTDYRTRSRLGEELGPRVARAHGLTERHVRSIERGMDGDDRQGGLF